MLGRVSHHTALGLFRALLCTIVLMLMASGYASAEEAVKTAEVTASVATTAVASNAPDVAPVETVASVNTQIIAEIDPSITVTLDGETLQSTEVHRTDKGQLYVNAMPIFNALENDHEYDDVSKALIVRRSQDGVVMELFTDTGIVKANGKALGKLPHFGEVADGRYILTPNAIAVLSGATGKFNKGSNAFTFKLDPRLKVATGFEVFVNDIALGNLNPAPKSIGPVMLLPLLPIAEALGADVRVLDSQNEVFVRRAQDSAEFTLNLDTGLVKLRDVPYGITKDVTYIDPINLLLPVSAIETLTGTHVTVGGGDNRIDIDLDERLTGAIKPMGSVDDEAKNTPLTLESVQFHLGPDTINTVDLDFRVKRLNGRLRYETPDMPTTAAELEPSWLSLEFAHINGVSGTIGDYAANKRELDGVGARRIRGVAATKTTDKGRWALAAGVPNQGAVRISDDQSRSTFGGFAAGARFASREGWEVGGAVKRDNLSDDQMAVLSAISGRLGRKKDKRFQWDTSVDLGIFDGPAREKTVDLRTNLSARYDVSESITLDSFAQYSGVEFLRSDLDAQAQVDAANAAAGIEDLSLDDAENAARLDTRRRGLDQMSVSTSVRFAPKSDLGFLRNPAASVRGQIAETGFLVDSDAAVTTRSVGASVATSIAETGLSISADVTAYEQSFGNGDPDGFGQSASVRAYKQFKHGTVRAQYQNSNVKGEGVRQSASLNIATRNFNVPLPKSATLSVSPSVTAGWTPDNQTVRGGLLANFNSGKMFGTKTRVDASLGILQSVSGQRENRTDKFLSVSVARRIPIGKNMALGLAYRNNLNGNQRVGLQLDGRFDFNEKRKYKATKEGRGVLKGRAFVDKNRDGEKQDDEPAVPNALVRIKGTAMALRTDRAGFYTIQNIKTGLYEVLVDGRSLPLGYAVSESVMTRATIFDGQITDVPLPIVQRGQIRGFTFIDDNANGEFDSGETRIDSVSLKLEGRETDDEAKNLAVSASFGQFAFDDLPGGEYVISALSQPKLGLEAGEAVTVDLLSYERLMAKIAVPMTRVPSSREEVIQSVEAANEAVAEPSTDPPPKPPNTMEASPIGPAPP